MFQRVIFILLSCFISIGLLTAAQRDLVTVADVEPLMEKIYSEHLQYKEMTPELMQRSLFLFIEQFDPVKIYLLEEEVAPYEKLSKAKLTAAVEAYKKQKFPLFVELNQLFQKAIERARKIRKEIVKELIQKVPETERLQLSDSYSKTEKELHEQIRTYFLMMLQGASSNQVAARLEQIETGFQIMESEYLYVNRQGKPLAAGAKDNLFAEQLLKAFTASLDAHSSYLSAQEANSLKLKLQMNFDGVGLRIRATETSYIIDGILPDSPAARSNKIQVGDELIAIDGKQIANWSLQEVVEHLQGKSGTSVRLELRRNGKPIQLSLQRSQIILQEGRVQSDIIPIGDTGKIGVIRLDSFYEGHDVSSVDDVYNALMTFQETGELKGVILDLRENRGGYVMQAVKVAGLFISTGVVVIAKDSDGHEEYYRDLDPTIAFTGPLIILISRKTASAAEIVAQTLKDYGRAVIVGDDQTYGKGTIQYQTITDNSNEPGYKVTVGTYYSVGGKSTQITGVKADIVVPGSDVHEKLGEAYLHFPMKGDETTAAFEDPLEDVDSSVKEWYLSYYRPYLEKKNTAYQKLIPALKKQSKVRLSKNPTYKDFIAGKALQGEKIEGDKTVSVSLTDAESSELVDKMQLQEAIQIMQDLIAVERNSD